jgi:hypothetical protein
MSTVASSATVFRSASRSRETSAAEHAFGDHLARAQSATGNDTFARLIALVDDPFGVLGFVGGPENVHQGRAET